MKQPALFVFFGGLQYLLDIVAFGVMIAFGVSTVTANTASRIVVAGIGFGLNRYITFEQRNESVQRFSSSLLRFLVFLLAATVLSTLLILGLERLFGAGTDARVGYKVVVEAALAVLSFFVSRHWIYRN